jgi:hypothetical protein
MVSLRRTGGKLGQHAVLTLPREENSYLETENSYLETLIRLGRDEVLTLPDASPVHRSTHQPVNPEYGIIIL